MALPTPPSYDERIPNDPFYWPGAEAYAYTNAGPVQINVAGSGISLDYSSSILYASGGGGGAVSVVFPITNAGTPIAPIIGIAPATTTTQGSVELATVAETDARLSTTVAVTPASLINYFSSNIFTQRGQLLTSLAASSPTLLDPPLGIPAGCVLVTDPLTPSGLNWSSTAGAFIPCACILAKGSILTGPAAATPTALPVGVDGSVLVADSTTALGLRWDLASGAFIPCACIIAKGTLISGAVANVPQPLAVGLDNYVLTADSTCTLGLKWAPAAAPPATPLTLGTVYACTVTDISGGFGNTSLGFCAGNNATEAFNVAIGVNTLRNSSAAYTTAVGSDAMTLNVTGWGNTGVGACVLLDLTSGCYNTATGVAALVGLTTGNYNTASGYVSGRNIGTGSHNVAIGSGIRVPVAGGSCQLAIGWNTICGAAPDNYWLTGNSTKAIKPGAGIIDCAGSCGTAGQALVSTGTNAVCWGFASAAPATPTTLGSVYGATDVSGGNENTAIGHCALTTYASSFYNTAVGVCALQVNTGFQNTAVGWRAMKSAVNPRYNTAVGHNVLCRMTSGNYNTVVGAYALQSLTTGTYNTSVGGVNLFNLSTGNCNTVVGGSVFSNLTSGSCNVGIGQRAVTSAAIVSNEVNIYNGVVTARFQGAAAAWTFVSDERDKTDIEPLPLGLEFVKALEPRKFKWNIRTSEVDKGKESSGFIAQEVLSVVENFNASYTNLVDTNDPEQYTFAQANLVPLLVNAIKELAARVEALENK